MNDNRPQLYALFLARFAVSFGIVTLLTLLPEYIELFGAEGFVVGALVAALTVAQTVAVIPVALLGDQRDKRNVLLFGLAIGAVTFAMFGTITSVAGFVVARLLQGLSTTASALMILALVGGRSAPADRASNIAKSNSARFAAGILGSVGAGALYELYGFETVFGLLVALAGVAFVATLLFVEPDEERVEPDAIMELAVNRRILTLTSFRAQYAVAVTLVRTWVPVYAGVAAAQGGLAYSATAVGVVVAAEKFTNMICQPYAGGISDRNGRALFVFLGGGVYGLVALAVPAAPAVGRALDLPATLPLLGTLSSAFLPLVAINGLLGVADSVREPASMALFADESADGEGGVASSFGIRSLVWRPGQIGAPFLGGWLMSAVGMEWVFYVGGCVAVLGVFTFLSILVSDHGAGALTQW